MKSFLIVLNISAITTTLLIVFSSRFGSIPHLFLCQEHAYTRKGEAFNDSNVTESRKLTVEKRGKKKDTSTERCAGST